jgi:hypothetical protein
MNGILLPKHKPRDDAIAKVVRYLHSLPLDKAFWVLFEPYKAERSNQQNKYLHAVCYKLLSDATGYDHDDIAEYCLGTHFGWKTEKCPKTPNNPNGVRDVPVRTTTRGEDGKRDVLTWDVFSDYVDWIQRFGATHNIFIPDPDPEWWRKDKQEAA